LVKIGDLGVSKIVASSAAMQGTRVGTPLYLSPELVKQQPYDFKVDIWATGCVLYHIACLEPPFQGENLIVLGNNIVSKQPSPIPSVYSIRLQSFVFRLMAKKPSDRPNIPEMLKQLPEPFKKDDIECDEEAATLATNNEVQNAGKPTIKAQTRINKLASPTSSQYNKKCYDQDQASSKNNIVKIINQDIFAEHLKPKLDNFVSPANQHPPNLLSKIDIELPITNVPKKPEIKQTQIKDDLSVKITPLDPYQFINKPLQNEDEKNMPQNQNIAEPNIRLYQHEDKKAQNENSPHTSTRQLALPLKRPETASSCQNIGIKMRPTLTLFRSVNINFNQGNCEQNSRILARPTSAGFEQIALMQAKKEQRVYDPYMVNSRQAHQLNSNERVSWQRPQSAMPIGKAVILPIISAKSAYQTYFLLMQNAKNRVSNNSVIGAHETVGGSMLATGIKEGPACVTNTKTKSAVQIKVVHKKLTINDLDI